MRLVESVDATADARAALAEFCGQRAGIKLGPAMARRRFVLHVFQGKGGSHPHPDPLLFALAGRAEGAHCILEATVDAGGP